MNNIKDIMQNIIGLIGILVLTVPILYELKKCLKIKNKFLLFWLFLIAFTFSIYFDQFPIFLVLIFILYNKYKEKNEEDLLFKPLGKSTIKIVIYHAIFRFIALVLTIILIVVTEHFGYKLDSQNVINDFSNSDSLLYQIWLAINITICAPIVEEYIFRHLFYANLKKKIGRKTSLIIVNILFTLLHFNILSSITIFIISTLNCILYEKYGYKAAVLNHFRLNFSTVVLLFFN